ncbi:hypothetical protein YC2023_066296 [Brassica napus]
MSAKRPFLKSKLCFGSERFFVGLETTSKLGYSQMDGMENLRVCPSAHTGRPRLSISTHISTLVLGLSTLALPVDYLGDFGPRGLSVQYTQDVRGCPPAHTGRLWLSVSTHRTSVAVRVCPSAHTGRLWLSITTHISTLVLGLSTLALPVDCSAHTGRMWLSINTHISTLTLPVDCLGVIGPQGLSVLYTQDVRGCPPAHTGRPSLSVCVRVCPCVSACVRLCPSAHTKRFWLSISTHISTLVLGLSTLALPVDCLGDFGPRGLSVLYTQDVCGCPPGHTGRPWLSVCVRVCPCVSVSTHRTSVAVDQYTYQHYTQDVRGCPSAHAGRLWLSVTVRQHTQDVDGCLCVSVSTHRTSVGVRQHTQDVRVCPSAHTGRPCVSVCVRHRPQDVHGCPSVHISARWSLDSARWPFSWNVWVIFGPRGLSVQYTHDVHGCSPEHVGRPWLSVAVRQHTQDVRGCTCVSVCVRQHTNDIRGCPSAHTGRPCVSVSTHRTSVCLRQHTQDVCGYPSVHISALWTSVGVRQHTQDVRVCPSAHTGRPCVSVCVRHHPQDVHGCPSVHISARWSLDSARWPFSWNVWVIFGPRGLSVQYTHDVHGCPPEHVGRPWLSVAVRQHTQDVRGCTCVSVCVRQHTNDIRGCPSAHTGRPCVSVSTHRTSVCLRQHTQDVCGYPSVHISARCTHMTSVEAVSRHRTSVGVCQHTHDICGCPCVSVSTHRTSVAVHKYTYQHVGWEAGSMSWMGDGLILSVRMKTGWKDGEDGRLAVPFNPI